MSAILSRQILRPLSGGEPQCRIYGLGDYRVARTAALEGSGNAIVKLPDESAYEVMSRAGLMLLSVGLRSRPALAPFLKQDPFSVGLYCAVHGGPPDFDVAKQMATAAPEMFAATYEMLRLPGQFLREAAYAPPSQLSILAGIMGPQVVFTNRRWGSLQALEQAEVDLADGIVSAAVVCTSFSLDDPFVALQIRREIPPNCLLCEAAASLVLARNSEFTLWRSGNRSADEVFYGTAHDLALECLRSSSGKVRPISTRPKKKRGTTAIWEREPIPELCAPGL